MSSIKDTTIVALSQILDPLLDIAFRAGISAREVNRIVRERAVRVSALRLKGKSERGSKSRVAIETGLTRTEVGRILRSTDSSRGATIPQQPSRRVLEAWYDSPQYLSPNGEPAVLPIFGAGCSFARLVAKHGGGIPVRAMLDELLNLRAVELLPEQRVRAKTRIPIEVGLTKTALASIGQRGRDLLNTLVANTRDQDHPRFEATACLEAADPQLASAARRELEAQGSAFIDAANAILESGRHAYRNRRSAGARRIGIGVFYFEDEALPPETGGLTSNGQRRHNLKRSAVGRGRRSTVRKPGSSDQKQPNHARNTVGRAAKDRE